MTKKKRLRKTAQADLRQLVSSSEELLESLGEQGGAEIDALRERATASIETAKRHLKRSAKALGSLSQDSLDDATGFVARRPWIALAVGLAVGALVGAGVRPGRR